MILYRRWHYGILFKTEKWGAYRGFRPVSYTHLDVYKRQPWYISRCINCRVEFLFLRFFQCIFQNINLKHWLSAWKSDAAFSEYLLISLRPVSYTHLDVYKRQPSLYKLFFCPYWSHIPDPESCIIPMHSTYVHHRYVPAGFPSDITYGVSVQMKP